MTWHAPWEFGAPVGGIVIDGGGHRSVKRAPAVASLDDAIEPQWIEGLATLYNTEHAYAGKIDIFMPGCFDETLKAGWPVRFTIDHDDALTLGAPADGLELHSDETGLAFRFPTDTANPLHRRALREIATNKACGASVKFSVIHAKDLQRCGRDLRLIHEAVLLDVSIGRKGVVYGAGAVLRQSVDEPLADYCRSGKLALRVGVKRGFCRLTDALYGVG